MSNIVYQESEYFQEKSNPCCSNHFGTRKDSWHHCHECRNKTALWQSKITHRYLRKYDSRAVLAICLNVVKHDGNHLSPNELNVVLSKLKRHIKHCYPDAGFQIALDASPNGRPHFHGLSLGLQGHEIIDAWLHACKLASEEYQAWSQVGEIEITLNQAIDYAFKVWGEHRDGRRVDLPNQGIKVLYQHNFFKSASKQSIEQELKALKPDYKIERTTTIWKPDDIEDEIERWITIHKDYKDETNDERKDVDIPLAMPRMGVDIGSSGALLFRGIRSGIGSEDMAIARAVGATRQGSQPACLAESRDDRLGGLYTPRRRDPGIRDGREDDPP